MPSFFLMMWLTWLCVGQVEIYDVDSELVRLHCIELPPTEEQPLSARTVDAHCVSPSATPRSGYPHPRHRR